MEVSGRINSSNNIKNENKSDTGELIQDNLPKVKSTKLYRFYLKNNCRSRVPGKDCCFIRPACELVLNKNNKSVKNNSDPGAQEQEKVETLHILFRR